MQQWSAIRREFKTDKCRQRVDIALRRLDPAETGISHRPRARRTDRENPHILQCRCLSVSRQRPRAVGAGDEQGLPYARRQLGVAEKSHRHDGRDHRLMATRGKETCQLRRILFGPDDEKPHRLQTPLKKCGPARDLSSRPAS